MIEAEEKLSALVLRTKNAKQPCAADEIDVLMVEAGDVEQVLAELDAARTAAGKLPEPNMFFDTGRGDDPIYLGDNLEDAREHLLNEYEMDRATFAVLCAYSLGYNAYDCDRDSITLAPAYKTTRN